MPSERSARVTAKRFLRNRSVKRSLRTSRTKAARALAGGDSEAAVQAVRGTLRDMDVAARKGVIHANKAARIKSRLARKLNTATADA